METTLQDVDLTPQGTVLETIRIVDVKDPVEPVKLLVREWIDTRHYRSVFVPEVLEREPRTSCREPGGEYRSNRTRSTPAGPPPEERGRSRKGF